MVGLATMGDYGINWDEPARLTRGQAFVEFFLTGKKSYGLPDRTPPFLFRPGEYLTRYDFLAEETEKPAVLPQRPLPRAEFAAMTAALGRRVSFYQDEDWGGKYWLPYTAFEAGHLPLPEILGAFSNRLFYQVLGIVGDLESSHLPYLLISALGVLIVTTFTLELTQSWPAAIVSGLSLALFPIFFAEAHFNLKDPLVASLFAGCVWSFWHWVNDNRLRWGAVFLAFLACSFGIKWNAIFLPFILVPWLVSIRKSAVFRRWFKPKTLLIYGLGGAIIILIFLIAIWPASWQQPLKALSGVAKFYWMLGVGSERIQPPGYILPFGFNSYPLLLLLSQTPEIVLLLLSAAAVGILRAKVGQTLRVGYLFWLWLLVPIIRYSLPFTRSYNGFRQILEVLPAMAMLAGLGAHYLLSVTRGIVKAAVKGVIAICFVILLMILIDLHPNQNVYFNTIVGGIRGAYRRNLIDFLLTNGNVYRQGANWLNEHAETGARVAMLDGRMFALSPLWLRPDISLSPYHFSGFDRQGEYILLINAKLDKAVFSYQYLRKFLQPVYEITVGSVAILSIYRNDALYLKPGFQSELPVAFTARSVVAPSGNYEELKLSREARVTRMILAEAPSGCQAQNNFAAIDELASFLPQNPPAGYSLGEHTYALMEREDRGGGVVEYLFPGELSKIIRIYPQSKLSCFAGGLIRQVLALTD